MSHSLAFLRPTLLALVALPLFIDGNSAGAQLPGRSNGTKHQRGVGVSGFAAKEEALARLSAVHDAVAAGAEGVGDRQHALEELADAIEELNESLSSEFWQVDALGNIEGFHLDPDEGSHVFHEERHCAQEIFDALRLGEITNPELETELLAIVDVLVLVDRLLADIQITDALGGGGDPEEIDEALAQLSRGDELVRQASVASRDRKAQLLYEAIDNAYRHAWEAAIDALEEVTQPLSADSHSNCGKGQCGGKRWNHEKPA
jgi:hypothetical protein